MFKHAKLRKSVACITLLSFLNLVFSCNYYKVTTVNQPLSTEQQQKVNEYMNMKKDFILHTAIDSTFITDTIFLNTEKQTLDCVLHAVPPSHKMHINNIQQQDPFKYKLSPDSPDDGTADTPALSKSADKNNGSVPVLNEIHLYINYTDGIDTGVALSIPFNAFTKADVIEKDNGRTQASYVFGTIGGLATAFIIIAVIVASTKSSCPFVYTFDGQGYTFDGEIYGGAIYPQLERDDYLPLTSTSVADTFKIRISNELKEQQYTNLASLVAVEHPSGVRVLPDKNGNVYTLSKSIAPHIALLDGKTDYSQELASKDDRWCLFNDLTTNEPFNELVLTFKKPAGVTNGKLMLNLKNSLWLDYLYGEFMGLFGSYYTIWKEKQMGMPVAEMNKWNLEQGIPLRVMLKTSGGWKGIDTLPAFGPLASREVIVPVDLSDVKSDVVELKLHCGFMFWEVNAAAMDFSTDAAISIKQLLPSSAIDETGKQITSLLQKKDGAYLTQLYPETVATISYVVSRPEEGNSVSYILHTSGWYNHIRDFKGTPDFAYLNTFRKPGAFALFSKDRYQQWNMVSLTAINR